ncbi:hypothetical protein DNU06_06995 [Putridiphycobacter roseus]|uniref:Lipoprotein n=1 Tax=Putridiphycobacter roseus TaxID=2219161 RepID=A0A2W1MZC4_9FLAO|nr:hypothetical protein [Putridiphycobacter roseus]PZE17569.1 hypothetical protein DNU06_06995 [Putridiphycobacter roseus]
MKYFALLSVCLLAISCGPRQLESADIQENILAETSILNTVQIGDSWEDVKQKAGSYWEVKEDPAFDVYQFRRDLDAGSEYISITFKLNNNMVGGIGVSVNTSSINPTVLKLLQADILSIYKKRFHVSFENNNNVVRTFGNKFYNYEKTENFRDGSSSIGVFCTVKL